MLGPFGVGKSGGRFGFGNRGEATREVIVFEGFWYGTNDFLGTLNIKDSNCLAKVRAYVSVLGWNNRNDFEISGLRFPTKMLRA